MANTRVEIRVTVKGHPESWHGDPDSLELRLARDLAEAMGDTLRCTEDPDGVSAVIITLPAAAGIADLACRTL